MTKIEEKPKNKSKRIANISLSVMAAGFLATLPFEQTTTVKIIQGAFEGGLVGGLADWFAVTALFRHPLGIPIPHTALLPKNRQKLTDAILNVAEKELLNKNSIMEKVSNINLTHLILGKLEEQLEKESMKDTLKQALRVAFHAIQQDKVEGIAKKTIIEALRGIDTKQLLTKVVDHSIAQHYDEKVYTVVFQLIEKKVSTKETKAKITQFLVETMKKKAENGFFKIALKPLISVGKDKLTSIVEKAVDDLLLDLQNEQSENRRNILAYIRKELASLKENAALITQLNEKKELFLQGESFEGVVKNVIESAFEKIETTIQSDEFIEQKVLPMLKNAVQKVKNNPEFVDKTETKIKSAIGNLIEENHSKIGTLIKENLDKLDNEALTDMMENKIGKDLAWIRLNGSICGFLFGMGISVIKILTIAS